MDENCFTCKELNVVGFVFGGNEKPCPYYPDSLPTTKDVVEVYCCDHYDPIEVNKVNIPKYTAPFFISTLGIPKQYQKDQAELQKARKSIRRNERFMDWVFGFSVGFSLGIMLLLINSL